jgi:hypothetical protein
MPSFISFARASRGAGGKRNKAEKGELRFPLSVGLSYDELGRIELDPDREVQGAVRLIFFSSQGAAAPMVSSSCSTRIDLRPRRNESNEKLWIVGLSARNCSISLNTISFFPRPLRRRRICSVSRPKYSVRLR